MKTKKIHLFLLLFLFCSFGVLRGGEEISRRDGYEWEDWTVGMKFGFLVGLEQAVLAADELFANFLKKLDKEMIDENSEIISDFKSGWNFYMMLGGVIVSQVINGVDRVYMDYANKHIPIRDVACLVSMRIKGICTEDQFEENLRMLRLLKSLKKE